MKVGERVIVVASWSSFFRQHGEITQVDPFVMIRLDGDDPRPIRVGEREVIPEEESQRSIGGAE